MHPHLGSRQRRRVLARRRAPDALDALRAAGREEAVDKEEQTIDFMLGAKRDVSAARRFFKKVMRAEHRRPPFSISADRNAAYPETFSTSQEERVVPKVCKPRRVKYLNKREFDVRN